MKRIISPILILLCLCTVALAGCNRKVSEPPAVAIRSGDAEIPVMTAKNIWNGAVFDREDSFFSLAASSSVEFPYIAIGDTITITFDGTMPNEIYLEDYVLYEDGGTRYSPESTQTVAFEKRGNTLSFLLLSNPASFLSSNSADYEPGASIRGFRLTCSFGTNECEYAFIIRSDAGSLGE